MKSGTRQGVVYESSSVPWFGPRKRARELLANRQSVLDPENAIDVLKKQLGANFAAVQRIRFIDYVHADRTPFRFTIALMWTYSNPKLRDLIFEQGLQIVKETGWYPLPQGERIGSRDAERSFVRAIPHRHVRFSSEEGRIRSIESAVKPDGGCAIRVAIGSKSILLDTGLPDQLIPQETDTAVLLSHFHLDHFGGVLSGRIGQMPIIMSLATSRTLLAQGRLRESFLKDRAIIVRPGSRLELTRNTTVDVFNVPHCPGATGFAMTDGEVALVFTGDIVVKTARHDFVPELIRLLTSLRARKKYLLLDATMAGRPTGASQEEVAKSVVSMASRYSDILLVSQDAEQLLYAYLDLFHVVKSSKETRHTVAFILSPKLKPVFQLLHSAFISRNLRELDVLLASQYGSTMSSWAESRSLFWRDGRFKPTFSSQTLRMWFLGEDEAATLNLREDAVGLIPIGRTAEHARAASLRGELVPVDSSPWTLHSDEVALKAVLEAVRPICETVLFHNFGNRLRQFCRKSNVEAHTLSTRPLNVG
jgi:glyoxylase-like metal-dependent hydrolase (beta-lactamase superfamily II)